MWRRELSSAQLMFSPFSLLRRHLYFKWAMIDEKTMGMCQILIKHQNYSRLHKFFISNFFIGPLPIYLLLTGFEQECSETCNLLIGSYILTFNCRALDCYSSFQNIILWTNDVVFDSRIPSFVIRLTVTRSLFRPIPFLCRRPNIWTDHFVSVSRKFDCG